jgi:hypothetical protein
MRHAAHALGAVSRPSGSGWDYLNLVSELGDPASVQRLAPAYANAPMLDSGAVALR